MRNRSILATLAAAGILMSSYAYAQTAAEHAAHHPSAQAQNQKVTGKHHKAKTSSPMDSCMAMHEKMMGGGKMMDMKGKQGGMMGNGMNCDMMGKKSVRPAYPHEDSSRYNQ